MAVQTEEADTPSPRKQASSLRDGYLLLGSGTPWNFLGVRLQYFPSWQEHRGQACMPASSVYQLSGKHSAWFQKRFLSAREKRLCSRTPKAAWVVGGLPAISQYAEARQTNTPQGQVSTPLWNAEVKSLSLAPTDLRESPGYTQQAHKFTVK